MNPHLYTEMSRSRADEISFFKSVGTGLEDLAAAELVAEDCGWKADFWLEIVSTCEWGVLVAEIWMLVAEIWRICWGVLVSSRC